MTEITNEARPDSVAGQRANAPVMRSVLHRRHADMGATFEMRGTWSVPSVYQSLDREIATLESALGFADVSARGKLSLNGEVDDLVRALTGFVLDPLQTRPTQSGGIVARIARDWALVLLAPSAEGDVMRLLDREQARNAIATDATGAYSGFLVAGPLLEAFLARTANGDSTGFVAGRCLATSWARIPAVIVTKELRTPAVEIYVSSDYGRYAWDVLERLAGTPVGWHALDAWGWK